MEQSSCSEDHSNVLGNDGSAHKRKTKEGDLMSGSVLGPSVCREQRGMGEPAGRLLDSSRPEMKGLE